MKLPTYLIFRRIKQLLLSTTFFSLLLMCQSLERVDYVKPLPAPRRQPSEIIIGYDVPQQKYFVLSEITIQYSAGYQREEILQRLRQMASESGADGILLLKMEGQQTEFMVASSGQRLSTPTYRLKVHFYRFLEVSP